MPPQRPFFSKSVTLIFDHDLDCGPRTWYQQKGCITRYTHVIYEGPKSYQSEDMAYVKVFADKQTDELINWARNCIPPIYRCGDIKKKISVHQNQNAPICRLIHLYVYSYNKTCFKQGSYIDIYYPCFK